MEQQMGGLRTRQTELLDRFLAIKDALQREMEETICYVQRLDTLAATEQAMYDAEAQAKPNVGG